MEAQFKKIKILKGHQIQYNTTDSTGNMADMIAGGIFAI